MKLWVEYEPGELPSKPEGGLEQVAKVPGGSGWGPIFGEYDKYYNKLFRGKRANWEAEEKILDAIRDIKEYIHGH